MKPIVLACAREQVNNKLRSVLAQQGFWIEGVCTRGAALLSLAQKLSSGVAVCTDFADIPIGSVIQMLPRDFSVVVLLGPGRFFSDSSGIITLNLPIDRVELYQTLKVLSVTCRSDIYSLWNTAETEKEIENPIGKAKEIIMARHNMSEADAHRFIQKRSMDCGVKSEEMAGFILSR